MSCHPEEHTGIEGHEEEEDAHLSPTYRHHTHLIREQMPNHTVQVFIDHRIDVFRPLSHSPDGLSPDDAGCQGRLVLGFLPGRDQQLLREDIHEEL